MAGRVARGVENVNLFADSEEDGVELSDYGNALQVGLTQGAEALSRGAEFVSGKAAEFIEEKGGVSDVYRAAAAETGDTARFWEEQTEEQRYQYSPGAQRALATEFATTDPTNAAWAIWQNGISPIALRMMESAPNMAVTLGPIGAAVRMGVTSKLALAGIEAVVAGGLSASYVASDIAKEVEALSPAQLKQVKNYSAYKEAGYSDSEIREVLKLASQTGPVLTTGAVVGASGAAVGPALGRLFSSSAKLAPRTSRAVAIEAPQEALEEWTENAATNYALGVPMAEGGMEAALSGAFVGGPTAGVFVALTGGKSKRQQAMENGYKEIYKTGTPEQIEFYKTGIRAVMPANEATEFFTKVEAEAVQEQEAVKRSVINEDEEAALKTYEEPTTQETTTPTAPTEEVATEKAAVEPIQPTTEEAVEETGPAPDIRQQAIESVKTTSAPIQEAVDLATDRTVLAPIEATRAALDIRRGDIDRDPNVGTPFSDRMAEGKSTAKAKPVKYRAEQLAATLDDLIPRVQALKAEGYNVAPIEQVFNQVGRGRGEGRTVGDQLISKVARSRKKFYRSPFGKATAAALNMQDTIDQIVLDLDTAFDQVVQRGATEEVITDAETKPAKKQRPAKQVKKAQKQPKKASKKTEPEKSEVVAGVPEAARPTVEVPVKKARTKSRPTVDDKTVLRIGLGEGDFLEVNAKLMLQDVQERRDIFKRFIKCVGGG